MGILLMKGYSSMPKGPVEPPAECHATGNIVITEMGELKVCLGNRGTNTEGRLSCPR